MKPFITSLLLTLAFAAPSFASDKLCTGTDKYPEFKGFQVRVKLQDNKIEVIPTSGYQAFDGTFEASGKKRKVADVDQVQFQGEDNDNGWADYWVDSQLLSGQSSGFLEVENRNIDGTTQAQFSCKDFFGRDSK